MFRFLPTPALPGFRVGLADDDTPGFKRHVWSIGGYTLK